MKFTILLFLTSVLLSNCTASAQTSVKPEKGCCLTAAPFCPASITVAPNIKINEASIIAIFEHHEVIVGKTWNCFALYENDELLHFGDGDWYWLDERHIVVTSTYHEISIDLPTGTATMKEPGNPSVFLGLPTYNGECTRADWEITEQAN